MTSADARGQLAMSVIEAAVAAMLIIAVIGAMTAMPRAQPIDGGSLDATAAAVAATLQEDAHRTAVIQICDDEHGGAEDYVRTLVESMHRPGMGMQVRIGREVFGPVVPAGPVGRAVALVPGCELEVLVWAI